MSGEKLRKALNLLGKSYGMNRRSATHVTHWKRWSEAGLPRSITTVREDIAAGIPEDRIQAYARCFQISAQILIAADIGPDDSRFIEALLGNRERLQLAENFYGFIQDRKFTDLFERYNSPKYLQQLFRLMEGVYECYWNSNEAPDLILRCALAIESIDKGFLSCRGAYFYYERENHIKPFIFRWLNNLHLVSMADEYRSLFHAMFVDPLKVPAIMNTRPLALFGLALSEDGEIGMRPMFSQLYITKISHSEKDIDAVYQAKTAEVFKHPCILTHQSEYAKVKERMQDLNFY